MVNTCSSPLTKLHALLISGCVVISALPHAHASSFSHMFSVGCSMISDDSAELKKCNEYTTTYVTDLSVSDLSSLVTKEISDARDTLDLMGFSKITNLSDLTAKTLSGDFNFGQMLSTDSEFSDALTTVVEGRYSEAFLAGLTEEESMSLYESEWGLLSEMVDMSGIGGDTESRGSVDLTKTETVEETTVVETTRPISTCDPDVPVSPCVSYDEFTGLTVVGASSGSVSQDVDGNYYLTTSSASTNWVTNTFTQAYSPTLVTDLSSSTVTRTQSRTAEVYRADRESMNTLEVVGATMEGALSCMNWEFKGVCIWIKWTLAGPKIRTSLKVANYVPELTFQNYTDADRPPWDESRLVMTVAQAGNDDLLTRAQTALMGATGAYKDTGGGQSKGNKSSGKGSSRSNTKFRLVDALGNPAATMWSSAFSHLDFFCSPTTTMMEPYYLSNLDLINWRQNFGVEFWDYKSWLVGAYMLGTYSDNNHYGSVYPRIGFTANSDDIKASILTTFRAAHFITRPSELHVYQSINRPHKDGLWVSNELDQDKPNTGKFQQLLPYKETKCHAFPLERNPDGKRRGETGATMWNFWRKVTCCKKRGKKLLFHT